MLSPERRYEVVDFLLQCEALRFGDFTTKSGRKSPYFVNMGTCFASGARLQRLASWYAEAIHEAFAGQVNTLLGPAYKGIPLAVSTAMQLHSQYGDDVGVTFNRKEVKGHGEGGQWIGKDLSLRSHDEPHRIVLVEDITTAGTAARELLRALQGEGSAAERAGLEILGMVVAFNRLERSDVGEGAALAQLASDFNMQTLALCDFDDLMHVLEDRIESAEVPGVDANLLAAMREYQQKYAVSATS